MSELKNILYKSILSGIADHSTALYFSGGIDSAVTLNLLLDNHIKPTLYALKMEDVESDDYKSFREVVMALDLDHRTLQTNDKEDLSKYKDYLIEAGIPKRKKASLLVMALFCKLIDKTEEDVIYTGLGSDAYYGLGRNFAIQCSLRGEKPPSIKSLMAFRRKTFAHYMEQYVAITKYAKDKGKILVAPFLETEVYLYLMDKTYDECNKPKQKQILIDLYPEYFERFKPRKPTNFHCGNSDFKKIKI